MSKVSKKQIITDLKQTEKVSKKQIITALKQIEKDLKKQSGLVRVFAYELEDIINIIDHNGKESKDE